MIIGEKVTLLPFEEDHLSLVQKWINQPQLRQATGTEGPVSGLAHRRWYEKMMSDPSQRVFVIGDGIDGSSAPVGLIGLKDINWRYRMAEYWIYIGEAVSRGCGVGAEATRLILAFAFRTLGLNRIHLCVLEDNVPAIRLYRKLGFVEEGIAREHAFLEGQFRNMHRFSMLAREFEGL